jgi:hypothetical protein
MKNTLTVTGSPFSAVKAAKKIENKIQDPSLK